MICTRILADEASHLKFQASMLARVASARSAAFQNALAELHRLFLLGTIVVVWREHRHVFRAAGYDFRRFKKETCLEFAEWNMARLDWRKRAATGQRAGIKTFGRVEPET
jgi:hypothetical protein